jgi:hypothetical protein
MALEHGLASLGGGYTMNEWERRQKATQPDWLTAMVAAQQQANAANQQRAAEIRAIYQKNIEMYRPGGEFETKSLEQLAKTGERFVEKGYGEQLQQAISSGTYGTTVTGGIKPRLRKQYEEEVGAPSRLRLEDILMQRLTSAQTGLASFLERQEDIGPGLSDIYNMAAQYGSSEPSTFERTYGGTYGNTLESGIGTYGTLGGNTPVQGTGGTVTRESAGLTPKNLPAGVYSTTPKAQPSTTSTPYPNYAAYVSASKAAGGKPYSESWAKRMRVIP